METNGTFINATRFVDQIMWTAGLDPKTGKPLEYDPGLTLQTYLPATRMFRADSEAKVACPSHSDGLR